jgi:hypothetical protein
LLYQEITNLANIGSSINDTDGANTRVKREFKWLYQMLYEAQPNNGSSIKDTDVPHLRAKRQLQWLPIIGTIWSGVNSFLIYKQSNEINAIKNKQNALIIEVDNNRKLIADNRYLITNISQALSNLVKQLNFQANEEYFMRAVEHALLRATQQTDMLQMAVQALMNRRLAPVVLGTTDMPALFRDIKSKVEAKGYRLLVTEIAHIFQCETSFIVEEGGRFVLITSIPTARQNDYMHLYQYVPSPIPVGNNSALIFHPTYDIIAVNNDQTQFRTMTTTELNSCQKIADVHLCERSNTAFYTAHARYIDEKLCTFHLYQRGFDLARKVCPAEIIELRDDVIQIEDDKFIVTSERNQQGFIHCPDNDKPHDFAAFGRFIITIPFGCWAEVPGRFQMTPSFTIDETTITGMTYHWDTDPVDMLTDIDLTKLEELRAIFDSVATAPPVKLTDIKEYMERRTMNYTAYAIAAVALFAAIAVIWLIYRAVRAWWEQRSNPTPTNTDNMQLIIHPTAPQRSILLDKFNK